MAIGYDGERRGPNLARLAPIIIALIPIAMMAIRGCQEGPFGRRQVVAISPQEEASLGAQAFQQVLAENRSNLVGGSELETVRRVGERIAAVSNDPDILKATKLTKQNFRWEFRVVASKQLNAFCLPGGKVVVYTGILPVCKTESGLATVMGHEIAHALAHHGAERMAQQKMVDVGRVGLTAAFSDLPPEKQMQMQAILGAGANFGILLPFSRSHESEADRIGLYLMAAAGYDPHEAARFWVRMQEASKSGGSPPEFMSTHPSSNRRSADLREWTPEAMPFFEKSRYRTDRDPMLPRLGTAPAEPFTNRFR
jgi:predicted Zn-dependent protease